MKSQSTQEKLKNLQDAVRVRPSGESVKFLKEHLAAWRMCCGGREETKAINAAEILVAMLEKIQKVL